MTYIAPSHVKAIVELLRGNATIAHPDVAALVTTLATYVSGRIDTQWLPAWDKPDGRIYNAVTVQTDGGLGVGVGGSDTTGVRSQGRVLIRCWSTTYHVANDMAQLVSQILYPLNPWAAGWTAASTHIDGCSGISEPMQYQEPDRDYQRAMMMSANVFYRRLAVAA